MQTVSNGAEVTINEHCAKNMDTGDEVPLSKLVCDNTATCPEKCKHDPPCNGVVGPKFSVGPLNDIRKPVIEGMPGNHLSTSYLIPIAPPKL